MVQTADFCNNRLFGTLVWENAFQDRHPPSSKLPETDTSEYKCRSTFLKLSTTKSDFRSHFWTSENVGADVGAVVGESVGLLVGEAVGVKLIDGICVGCPGKGSSVGALVGAGLGRELGEDVGFDVGSPEGSPLGCSVG
jgi:hypothetical protein